MRKIPEKLLKDLLLDSYYHRCCRRNEDCFGRITLEHSVIYGGTQINERWAIIPECLHHHLGTGLDKRLNELIAISRMTEADKKKYPKVDWDMKKKYLEKKYGKIKDGKTEIRKELPDMQ